MQIIISPAKKMRVDTDTLEPERLPIFLDRTRQLHEYLRTLEMEELRKLLSCNQAIAELNYERYQNMDLERNLTPAILAYDGIQYQYMAPQVFEGEYFRYVQERLYILSGFYGALRPMDGVTPYRLEMQAKLRTDFCKDLYDFWGANLGREVCRGEDVVLNLASAEYSRAVRPHVPEEVRWVDCVFGELIGGKVVEKGVYVKMARGEMVRFMAERGVEDVRELTGFDRLDYVWDEERSTPDRLVFLKGRKDRTSTKRED